MFILKKKKKYWMDNSPSHFCISQIECFWKGQPNGTRAQIRYCLLITSGGKAVEVDVSVEVDIRGSGGRGRSSICGGSEEVQTNGLHVVLVGCVCICAVMVGHPGMH